MYKIILLLVLALGFAYDMVTYFLSLSQKKKPLPESVRHIYDDNDYVKWTRYSAERAKAGMVEKIFEFAVTIAMFSTDVFSTLYYLLPGGEYVKSILLMLIYSVFITLISLPFSYNSEIVIESKYGFNNSNVKTFAGDQIKGFIINSVINIGLLCFVIAVYKIAGFWMFVAIYAVIAVFIIVFSMLSMTFQKIFNKFEPLPDGELREILTAMFSRAGYHLSDILVMNASLRTKKVNAFCTGLGKFKKIVLYDNLVNNYSDGEIAAVFAHELAHYRYRDTAKLTLYNLLRIILIVAVIASFVLIPQISIDFGFEDVSIVFAIITMTSGVLSPIMTLADIPLAFISRKFEYRADAMAVDSGYGDDMISALTKLSRDNFADLNPHPVIVAIEYTHPTIGQRIEKIKLKMLERVK